MERQAEYAETVTNATRILQSELPPDCLPDATCELLISVQPTFENWTSWALFPDHEEWLIRRLRWDKTFDTARFLNPLDGIRWGWHTTPKIAEQFLSIPKNELHEIMEIGRQIKIQPESHRGLSIDGTEWVLKWPTIFGEVIWNGVTPKRQEIASWAAKMVETLENRFAG